MRQLTVGSLFSGIGGIDLGLQRAGMVIRWHSEIDPYASRVLAKHWPDVPSHGDITRIDFTQVEPVDVLAGGFPCQDISNAGRRGGIDGKRSGLWSEYVRAVGELRPRYVLVENVAALLVRGIDRVLGDLAALGYDAEWDCLPAAAVGAPHIRDRLFLVAHRPAAALARPGGEWRMVADASRRGQRASQDDAHGPAEQDGLPDVERSRSTLADTERPRLEGYPGDGVGRPRGEESHRPARAPRLFGRIHRFGGWDAEPDVGRVADGIPRRVDRLRGLGNAVVPQIPEVIGGWIIEHARATGYLESAA